MPFFVVTTSQVLPGGAQFDGPWALGSCGALYRALAQLTRGPWAVSMAHRFGLFALKRTADQVQAARSPNNFFIGCPLIFDLPPPP